MFTKHPLRVSVSYVALTLSLSPLVMGNDSTMEHVEVYDKKEEQGLSLNNQHSSSNRLGLAIADVAASVEVITKESMAIKADYSALSAVSRATGFAATGSPGNGGSSFSARGFEGHGSIVQTYNGTRLYVGSGAVTFPADTWPFEQVDILRGPGSVINGVGAIGATVNYVPKMPTFSDISSEIDLAAGSFGLRRIAFGSGGQLQSNLAYRIDGVNHQSTGYVDNGGEKRNVLSTALTYKPAQNIAITASIDYANVDASTYFGTPLVNDKLDKSIRKNNYNVKDAIANYEDLWPRIAIDWQINDNVQLNSQTYYLNAKRHWRNVEGYEADLKKDSVARSYYIEILHDQQQVGNRSDVLFNFKTGDMLNRLSVGAEVNHIDFSHANNKPYGKTSSEIELFKPKADYWSDANPKPVVHDFSSSTLQYALFVDYYIELLENVSFVSGFRYDAFDYVRNAVAIKDVQEKEKTKDDFSATSWRVGTVYSPLDNMSLYLQYSEATDAIQSILTATKPGLKLAKGKQVELGIKQALLDEKVQFTLALFDIKKTNLIDKQPGMDPRQIGQQSSKGIELDIFVQPVEVFDININFAAYKAKFDHFTGFTGNRPQNVPDKTANLWMNWQFVEDWQLSGGMRYVSKRFSNNSNDKTLPAYQVYDASLAWQVSDAMQLTLRGKNLSDSTDYVLTAYGDQWILGPGRSAEVSMRYVF